MTHNGLTARGTWHMAHGMAGSGGRGEEAGGVRCSDSLGQGQPGAETSRLFCDAILH